MEENQILRGHDGKVWIVHLTGSNAVICRCMSRFSLQGAKQVNSHYTSGHHKERNECIEASDVAVRGFVNTVKQGNAAKHPAFTPFNAQLLFDWDETEKEKFVLDVVILWCLRYWKTTRANQSTRAGCCKLNFVHCAEMGAKVGGRFAPFPTALPTDANELQRFKVAFEAISLTGLGQTEQQQLQVVEEEMHTEQKQRHAMQCGDQAV